MKVTILLLSWCGSLIISRCLWLLSLVTRSILRGNWWNRRNWWNWGNWRNLPFNYRCSHHSNFEATQITQICKYLIQAIAWIRLRISSHYTIEDVCEIGDDWRDGWLLRDLCSLRILWWILVLSSRLLRRVIGWLLRLLGVGLLGGLRWGLRFGDEMDDETCFFDWIEMEVP